MEIRQGKMGVSGRWRSIPPQQEELQTPISKADGGLFGPASARWDGPCQQVRDAGGAAAVCLEGGIAGCTEAGRNVCAAIA